MLTFITLVGAITLGNLAFVVLQLLTLRPLGFVPLKVGLGLGPRIVRLSIAGVPLEVGAFPVGAYVQIEGWADPEVEQASRPRRLALVLLPWLGMLALTVPVLGFSGTLASFVAGFAQALRAVFPEYGGGAPLIARFVALFHEAPLRATAVFLVKLSVFNLLPLPSLAGGNAIALLLPLSERVRVWASTLGLLVMYATLGLGWLISFYRYFAG